MKIAVLALLLIVSLTGPAWARLGETEDQLTARYGTPRPKETFQGEGSIPDLIFQKGGFNVYVFLLNGVSAQESFSKVSGDAITLQEVRTLLSANAQGRGWEAPQKMGGKEEWMRDDGSAAKLTGGSVFTITAKELLNADATARKEILKPTLDGF